MRFLLLLFICAVCRVIYVFSVELPQQTCPEYFQYMTDSTGQFFGKLSIPELPYEMITVKLRLSQYEFPPEGVIGHMSHWIDKETNVNHLKNREPIEMRVLFSTQKELPKVTLIAVNDIEICTSENLPAPSKIIVLHVWFTPPNAKQRKNYAPELEDGLTSRYDTRKGIKPITTNSSISS